MSGGCELLEILRVQIFIPKDRGDSWAWIGAFLGMHPATARQVYNDRWKGVYTFILWSVDCPEQLA